MSAANRAPMAATPRPVARCAIRVRGTVQGVGFRPAVYRIARAAGLGGFVRNDAEGVWIEVEGPADELGIFVEALRREAPPLSRIDAISSFPIPVRGESEFVVLESEASHGSGAGIPADVATCDACLRELFDERDRRHRYAFINCTDCGPRYTIVRDLPYDRSQTTMSAFTMCAQCKAEYEDPGDRRFHAEPNACPACGPQMALVERGAVSARGDSALRRAAALLDAGAIVAVKGLGGYQLAAAAAHESAVARLRTGKQRPDKPFALLARDIAAARTVAYIGETERAVLLSPARPIVLLEKREDGAVVSPSVAPALGEIGIMLPATPLHHLLSKDAGSLLVMTSGNVADEPIAKDDDEAFATLSEIADALLVHDRAIHTRADDSVVRVVAGALQPVRRARGYVPDPIALGFQNDGPSVLAVGGELKSTVCITRGSEAHLSQHIGDLSRLEARAFFDEVVVKLGRLLSVEPALVAHDLHPEYASTQWAQASGRPAVAVQHHHAHIASCMAEHGVTARVIGVAFDGTGCGPDGDLWGGEVLVADLSAFERRGHLRPLSLAGGEAAIRQPWRLAVAALLDAGESLEVLTTVPAHRREMVARLLASNLASPHATGAGRWFDAVAALLGVRETITYEAQAAVELEALAAEARRRRGLARARSYPFDVEGHAGGPFVVDLRPAVRAIVAARRSGEPVVDVAAGFYATMAAVVADACRRVRQETGLSTVALSGGCFQSRELTEAALVRLSEDDFDVLVHRRVPPNDGGLALGQAAVAAFRARTNLGSVEGRSGTHVPRDPR
jgi:hydrogenase maturation protein HypF